MPVSLVTLQCFEENIRYPQTFHADLIGRMTFSIDHNAFSNATPTPIKCPETRHHTAADRIQCPVVHLLTDSAAFGTMCQLESLVLES